MVGAVALGDADPHRTRPSRERHAGDLSGLHCASNLDVLNEFTKSQGAGRY